MTGVRYVCSGCGASPPPEDPYPFRCPRAGGDDVDHVMVPEIPDANRDVSDGDDDDRTFVRYRRRLSSYHAALAAGLGDEEYVALVDHLDRSVAAIDGRGFRLTPFDRSAALSAHLGLSERGGVWVKDETGNVAGSHKGRHLMAVALHLEVMDAIGRTDRRHAPDLAIASCGNAALAAAVVARASGRRLRVFVPVDADPGILHQLDTLEAEVVVCGRGRPQQGDPTYAALGEALKGGAVPFTCQGNQNGLVIEGGCTLGYEMIDAGPPPDHVVVQVGGGALASSVIRSMGEACPARVHTVQTEGAHPLERAYARVRALALPPEEALRRAATHRSEFMWPWEEEPRSIATGILDDETYDWLAVVRGMITTGGRSVVVSEARLAEAHALGRHAGYPVDPTGAAGLAGLLDLRETGAIGPDDRVAVLFTGVERRSAD